MGSPGAKGSQAGGILHLAEGVPNGFRCRSARQRLAGTPNHQERHSASLARPATYIRPHLCGGHRFRVLAFLPEYCDGRTVVIIRLRVWLTWLTRQSAGSRIYSSTAHSPPQQVTHPVEPGRVGRRPDALALLRMSASPLRIRLGTALLRCGRTHCARSRCRARQACLPPLGVGGVAPRPDTWTAQSACICLRENIRCASRGLTAHAPELDRPSFAHASHPCCAYCSTRRGLLVGPLRVEYGARRRHGASARAQILRHPRSRRDGACAMHPRDEA